MTPGGDPGVVLHPTKTNRREGNGTMNKRNKVYEAPEMEQMITRVLKSLVRRAAEGDLEAISALRNVAEKADDALVSAVQQNREGVNAYSWTEIGRELGISRQGAQQRFEKRVAS